MLTLDPTVMAERPPHDEPDPQVAAREDGDCVACLLNAYPVCDDHAELVIELL